MLFLILLCIFMCCNGVNFGSVFGAVILYCVIEFLAYVFSN